MNTWVITLACKTFNVIVTQGPADPAKVVPPHPPEWSYCQGQHRLSEKVMSPWGHWGSTLSFGFSGTFFKFGFYRVFLKRSHFS